jgi:hypothetical protein
MRSLAYALAAAGLLGVAGCADDPGPCSAPAGCSSVARLDGACTCSRWETTSVHTVALPYVVLGVRYSPVGTASIFRYGFTEDPSTVPQSAAAVGTTLRAVIRHPDGSERIARLAEVDASAAGRSLTDTAIRAGEGGIWTLTTQVDLPSSRSDEVTVWANPAVTIATDYVGEKTVSWSSRHLCLFPGLDCDLAQAAGLPTALLRGEGTANDPSYAAYLDALGPAARAELLAFDPREAGLGVDLPRYARVADVAVDATPRPVDATWQPCRDPESFEVLAETAVPLDDGDTLVLQYGALPEAACTPQRPGLVVGTATAGCSLTAAVFVDRLSGMLLMQPSGATSACTQ